MKLLCARRKGIFRPRMRLEQTGYSGASWQWTFDFLGGSGRLANCGWDLVTEATPAQALVAYFDLLRRLKCEPWDGVERDGRRRRPRTL